MSRRRRRGRCFEDFVLGLRTLQERFQSVVVGLQGRCCGREEVEFGF